MDAGWYRRMRWRRRGAWLWPAFVTVIVVDAVVGHTFPPTGESQSFFGAAVTGCVLTLIAVILLTRPLSLVVRRVRQDLPVVVARNYAGTGVIISVTAALLAAGLIHRSAVQSQQRTMRDAIARAQAWIGDRAPPTFRRNVQFVSTVEIQPGSVNRMCVPDDTGRRNYCVVVNTRLPFARSVSFAGTEPNSVFSEGSG